MLIVILFKDYVKYIVYLAQVHVHIFVIQEGETVCQQNIHQYLDDRIVVIFLFFFFSSFFSFRCFKSQVQILLLFCQISCKRGFLVTLISYSSLFIREITLLYLNSVSIWAGILVKTKLLTTINKNCYMPRSSQVVKLYLYFIRKNYLNLHLEVLVCLHDTFFCHFLLCSYT